LHDADMSKSNNPAAARRGRDPNKESFWRELLSRQSRSGLTVRAFCDREALRETAFYFWRKEIQRRDGRSTARRMPALSFVELHAATMPTAVDPVAVAPVEREAPLELLLPGDRRLLIHDGCDAGLLQRVVAALAAASSPTGSAANLPTLSLPAVSLSKGKEGRSC
jgi:transposase-like protein